MADPIGWLKKTVVDPAIATGQDVARWTGGLATDVAKNVAGPVQDFVLGDQVPGFLARPLAGTEKQYVQPAGPTGSFAAEGHPLIEAGQLERFQEKAYPAAEETHNRLLASYQPGGANREAWVRNAMSSTPGAERAFVEGVYDEQVFPKIASTLRSPVLPGPSSPTGSGGYYNPQTGAQTVVPAFGWSPVGRGAESAFGGTPIGPLLGHEGAHAGAEGTDRGRRGIEGGWPGRLAGPTEEELEAHRSAAWLWRNDAYNQRDPWFQKEVAEGKIVWPRPRPEAWWEASGPFPEDLGRNVREQDKALWGELFSTAPAMPLSPGTHSLLPGLDEPRGNVHALRALLQERRGSGEILPEDVRRIMEGGFTQAPVPYGEHERGDYGGSAGVGDLGWMLQNRRKVDIERATEILNLLSARTPLGGEPRGGVVSPEMMSRYRSGGLA